MHLDWICGSSEQNSPSQPTTHPPAIHPSHLSVLSHSMATEPRGEGSERGRVVLTLSRHEHGGPEEVAAHLGWRDLCRCRHPPPRGGTNELFTFLFM